jgi:uncharacterized protein (TIGR03435 family)
MLTGPRDGSVSVTSAGRVAPYRPMRIPNRLTRQLLPVAAIVASYGPLQPPRGQAQSQPAPAFDVASIKPADPAVRTGLLAIPRCTGGPGTNNPGQLTCTNYTLRLLIGRAYNAGKPWQFAGPASLGSAKFDILAKVPPGATQEQFDLMLRNLLAERFGLVVHWESREVPVYELVTAGGGSKLREAKDLSAGEPPFNPAGGALSRLPKDGDGWPVLPPGAKGLYPSVSGADFHWSFRIQPVADLAAFLERNLVRPVLDKTGLAGTYSFDLTFGADSPADLRAAAARDPGLLDGSTVPAPRLIDAVGALGLKLVSGKGPVQVLVVDRVNTTPTEN